MISTSELYQIQCVIAVLLTGIPFIPAIDGPRIWCIGLRHQVAKRVRQHFLFGEALHVIIIEPYLLFYFLRLYRLKTRNQDWHNAFVTKDRDARVVACKEIAGA